MRYFLMIFRHRGAGRDAHCRAGAAISPATAALQIFPDMKRQLKLRPQTANGFFANGLSSQLPPPGTIAQEHSRCWWRARRFIHLRMRR